MWAIRQVLSILRVGWRTMRTSDADQADALSDLVAETGASVRVPETVLCWHRVQRTHSLIKTPP